MSKEKIATSSNKNAAVFLDRDGTIIEDRGHLCNPSDVVFFPETFEALQKLQKYYRLFIITNQPGIAQGIISLDDVEIVNNHVKTILRQRKIDIADIYVCPHKREDGCECIKPNPYFLQKSERDYKIDLQHSFVVGDHPHDVQLAKNAGARGIYILTGHGRKHVAELPENTEVVSGIMEAVKKIISYHPDSTMSRSGIT